jgi:hypothetical protein
MPFKRTAVTLASLLVIGPLDGSRVAEAQDSLQARVAERLATEMTTEEAFKRWSLGPEELIEIAATPGGLYFVIPRGLTAVSDSPVDVQAIALCAATANESMRALISASGLLETRVQQAVGRRLNGTKQVAFNNTFTDRKAAQIVGALSDVAASDFAPLIEIRSDIAKRISGLLNNRPDLLGAIDDPAVVSMELQQSRRRVVDLLEKAGAPLPK